MSFKGILYRCMHTVCIVYRRSIKLMYIKLILDDADNCDDDFIRTTRQQQEQQRTHTHTHSTSMLLLPRIHSYKWCFFPFFRLICVCVCLIHLCICICTYLLSCHRRPRQLFIHTLCVVCISERCVVLDVVGIWLLYNICVPFAVAAHDSCY